MADYRGLTSFSRRKWRRGDREAVASVIGTIFALMIFLSLLTLLVTAFVPSWEKSNEQDFLNTAIFQMGQVKGGNMDLIGSADGNTRYVSFNMAPSKVPLFGKNYLGQLDYRSSGGNVSSMNISFSSNGIALSTESTGSISYRLINAYSNQQVVYQHGAVILVSIDGSERNSVFKSAPPISYTSNGNGTYNLRVSQIDFVGTNVILPSSGTVGVSLTLTEPATQQTHMVNGGAVTLRWVSQDTAAWAQWAESFGIGSVNYTPGSDTVTLTVTNVYSLQYTMVKTQMVLE